MTVDIRALIFDMDGVLTDTVELHHQAWLRVAAEYGVPPAQVDRDRLRGLSRYDCLRLVFAGRTLGARTIEAIMARKSQYFIEQLPRLSPADCLPGIMPLLAEARAAGIRLGVASSSQHVRVVLERLALAQAFDAVGDAFTVARTKPDPDIFVWVAGRLDVQPGSALVFEDSQAGVEAARTAGFWTVGVGDEAVVGGAHIVVPSLDAISLPALVARLR